MKSKYLFQILVALALLLSSFGSDRLVHASADPSAPRDILQGEPTISMIVSPSSVNPGETALATVRLNNVPASGYSSMELTCTYLPNLVEANNIIAGDLFGIDPAVAVNGPQDGRFIVAIASSDGRKATSSGVVMVFNLSGLEPGQSPLDCQARVSKGDNALTAIVSTGSTVIVLGPTPTPTFKPTDCDKAEFIADINVPPGTVMAPGAKFTKTWRLKNVGSCTWTTSYRVAFLSGEQMGAPSSIQFPRNVAPGVMVDLSLSITAPYTAGSYRGYWIFQNATGASFGVGPQGNQPWFVGIVVSDTIATPTTSLTPSPSPSTAPTATATPTASPTTSPTLALTSTPPTPPISSMYVRVTSPNNGEVLPVGSTYRITWDSTPDIDRIFIGYKWCDSCLDWIAFDIPNTGSYDWNVRVGNFVTMQFQIYIIGYDTGMPGSASDVSDNYITVLQSTETPPIIVPGFLAGRVHAGKPVTVSLYDDTDSLITSVTASPDGTFHLTAPTGSYTVRASASGFLGAQGSAMISGGNTDTKNTISLLAGDIDGNNSIDQFDALTIGMNYNTASPSVADLNNDGTIDVLDLELLARNYRKTGPVPW